MVGRKIIVRGRKGEVTRWEPCSSQMCDALIRFENGSECWFASFELRPDPDDLLAEIPLPSRKEAEADRDRQALVQMDGIARRLQNEEHREWPGAEFGKVILSQSIASAITEVTTRIKERG